MSGKYSGNYSGRSDYKAGKSGVESDINSGDKGIPPGIAKTADQKKTKGGVERNVDAGDKGIPPMNSNPTAKAPLD